MNIKLKYINLTLVLLVILMSFGFTSIQQSKFSFDDKYGNTITIFDFETISDKIDKELLIKNINGSLFSPEVINSNLRFDFIISDFKKVNRNNYKFRIIQQARTDDIRVLLKYMGGGKYYNLKIKKTKKRTEFIEVEYLYSFT